MVSALGLLVGSGIAAIGFVVMRNPMQLALLAPGAEGYYQRMVLDPFQRLQLRMVGMVASFFGLVVLTAMLSGLLESKVFDAASGGLLVLLWLSFAATFGFGLIYFAVQLIRGRKEQLSFGWFKMWKRGRELGPISVYPPVTHRMHRESTAFTVLYCLLVALALVVAIVVR